MELRRIVREPPARCGRARARRARLRQRDAHGPDQTLHRGGAADARHRPPPRQLALRRRQPRRRRRLLDRRGRCATSSRELGVELTPEIAEALYIAVVTDTGRFQYTNTTPKALRLAAELVEAGADVHRVFQARLRVGRVREAEAARPRARAGAGVRGRAAGRLVPAAQRLHRAERRRGVLEGIIDYLRAVEGAEMAALIREPPRRDGPPRRDQLARLERRARRLRDRAQVGRRRAPAGRRVLQRRLGRGDHRVHPPRVPCRRGHLSPSGLFLIDKPEGPSSFAVVADVRRRTGARTGHAGTLDPFATGLLLVLSGAATQLAPCFVGLDKRYLTDVDLTRARRDTGDREGVGRSARPSRRATTSSEQRLAALRGEVELPVPTASAVKIGGERAYKLHRRRAWRSRCPSGARAWTRSTSSPIGDGARAASTCASARARTCARSRRRSAATARTLRRTEVGPFLVEEADPERLLSPEDGAGTAVNVARQVGRSSSRSPARSRSGPSTACTWATGACSRPRSPPDGRRRWSRFDPHPRAALGYGVELLAPLERRLELLAEAGIEETLVVDFDLELAQLAPEAFAERVLRPLGTEVVVAGSNFRFGRGRAGDLALLRAARLRRQAGAARGRCLLDADPRPAARAARSTGRRSCSGVRRSSPAPSWRATRAAARSASRPRTCGPSRGARARLRDLRAAPRTAIARRSRSARTRTTAATSGESRPSCSTSQATSTASA